MSYYPTYMIAHLLEIGGNWCGSAKQEMEWVPDADPPEYTNQGSGDFQNARLWREDLGGGNYTWRIQITYQSSGPCGGLHEFVRNVAADDPTGDYCLEVSGTKDCDAGKLGMINND